MHYLAKDDCMPCSTTGLGAPCYHQGSVPVAF